MNLVGPKMSPIGEKKYTLVLARNIIYMCIVRLLNLRCQGQYENKHQGKKYIYIYCNAKS